MGSWRLLGPWPSVTGVVLLLGSPVLRSSSMPCGFGSSGVVLMDSLAAFGDFTGALGVQAEFAVPGCYSAHVRCWLAVVFAERPSVLML